MVSDTRILKRPERITLLLWVDVWMMFLSLDWIIGRARRVNLSGFELAFDIARTVVRLG